VAIWKKNTVNAIICDQIALEINIYTIVKSIRTAYVSPGWETL